MTWHFFKTDPQHQLCRLMSVITMELAGAITDTSLAAITVTIGAKANRVLTYDACQASQDSAKAPLVMRVFKTQNIHITHCTKLSL